VRSPGKLTLADQWLSAKTIHADMPLPVVGEIAEGKVTVELDKASFGPNTEVSLITAGGRQVQGSVISTAIIGFRTPVVAVVDVEGAEKANLGGTLLLADGAYKKDGGIVIARGTKVLILVKGKSLTGKASEEIRITGDQFELPGPVTRQTRGPVWQQSQLTVIDKWSSAKILFSEFPLPISAEIVEGKVLVELDKASFRPNTQVSAIAVGGKHLRGTTVSTAAIGFRMPVEAVIDVSRAQKQVSMSGMLLSAEGVYKRNQGIVIAKGTSAIILTGAETLKGKTSEEIKVGTANLRINNDVKGFRRLTQ
jgi:hypothetical protein